MSLRRLAVLAMAILAATAITASAYANSGSNSVSSWGVTETLTVDYNQTTCSGYTAYQIYQVSAKFTRPDLNKTISDNHYNAGETGGPDCSGNFVSVSDNSNFSYTDLNNWSCPDAYHSCTASRSYSWPYLRYFSYSVEGANLNGKVYDRNLGTLGWICTTYYLWGSGTCA